MINKGYIKVEEIIEGVYGDMGIQSFKWNDSLRWVGRVLSVMGLPNFYMEKVTNGKGGNLPPIQIQNYKGELPGDFVSSIMARDYECKIPMYITTGVFQDFYDTINSYKDIAANMQLEPIVDVTYNDLQAAKTWRDIKEDWFNEEVNWWYAYKPFYNR